MSTIKNIICASAITFGIAVTNMGCPQAAAAAPSAVALVDCVANAAIAGDDLDTIVATCGSDAVTVAEVLLAKGQTDSRVASSKAAQQVDAIRALLSPPPVSQ